MQGIDISSWNPVSAVDTPGTEFAIVKATQGTGYVSPLCDAQYQHAKQSGKKTGVYHYASGGNPIDEANFFVDNIIGYLNDAQLFLDWESAQNGRFGEHASWCLAFAAQVFSRTGIRISIYMSASVIRLADWSSLPRNNYGLWIAGYPDLRDSWDVPDFMYDIGPWPFVSVWQYTNSNGALDRDIFYGDARAWDAYAGVKQAPPQVTTTTTATPPPVTTTTTTLLPVTTTTTTKEIIMEPITTTTTTHTPATNNGGEKNYHALSKEEFAALSKAGAFTMTDGYTPLISDKIRMFIYLVSGIGIPTVAVLAQTFAVLGNISPDTAVQISAIWATFFGSIAGLFGVAHFTKQK